jgi:hypothetical protein
LDNSGAREFLDRSTNFPFLSSASRYIGFAPAIIVQPDNAGAGGDELFIHPDSDGRLATLLKETAAEVDIPVTDNETHARPHDQIVSSNRTDWLHFAWVDGEAPPDEDDMERIEPDKLQRLGQALSLVLTQVVRQTSY